MLAYTKRLEEGPSYVRTYFENTLPLLPCRNLLGKWKSHSQSVDIVGSGSVLDDSGAPGSGGGGSGSGPNSGDGRTQLTGFQSPVSNNARIK